MTNQELIILSSKCKIFLSFYVLLLELVIKCLILLEMVFKCNAVSSHSPIKF